MVASLFLCRAGVDKKARGILLGFENGTCDVAGSDWMLELQTDFSQNSDPICPYVFVLL